MVPKGQKRKLAGDEDVSEESGSEWESQRQFVFSVSLTKYQHSQELVEPSLRRFVLISNTLRQLSGETSAGTEAPGCPPAAASGPQVKERQSAVTEIPAVKHGESSDCGVRRSVPGRHARGAVAVDEEDWASMSTEPDFEVETAIASILSALDSTIDGSPQAVPRSPLRSLENLSEGGASWEKQEPQAYLESWQPEACRVQDGGVAVATAYLSDVTVEDLFQDIDASLLEADMEVLGVTGGHPAGDELLRYLPPFAPSSDSFAIALNQNLKCLPAFSSFIPAASPSSSSQREGFEMEHLMEVRVES
ncbi:SERTA domain-containing protein 3 [Salarias fasciatus]|uniref:SERTA domain-containing protein 3 n=1 Tax=Salarias fasciatus TaxID=181472 RepID=UPI001176C5FC|nr:cell division cycle-associated protein 4-like [Salarias fasciatus]XP_029965135.1 cell division cycle-associated protein 4-like [Salarias fasciatus]